VYFEIEAIFVGIQEANMTKHHGSMYLNKVGNIRKHRDQNYARTLFGHRR
jgi:hypothetical protein